MIMKRYVGLVYYSACFSNLGVVVCNLGFLEMHRPGTQIVDSSEGVM